MNYNALFGGERDVTPPKGRGAKLIAGLGSAIGGAGAIVNAFVTLNWSRMLAVLLFLLISTATGAFVGAMRPGDWSINTPWLPLTNIVNSGLFIGLFWQAVLTWFQRPLWAGGQKDPACYIALAVGALTNAASLALWVSGFDDTGVWFFLTGLTPGEDSFGVYHAAVLALAVGAAGEAAPELLWNRGGRAT